MKSVYFNSFIALSLIVVLSSCSSMMYTTLDILRPAEVSFPPEVSNVIVVNNSVVQPSNVGHFNTKLYSEPRQEILEFDSAGIFCTASLREALENKGFFRSVKLSLVNQNTSDNFYQLTLLSPARVKSLCNTFNADAVISLNKIVVADNITEYMDDYYDGYFNDLDVKVSTYWSIYYPSDKAATHIQFADSFTWQSSSTIRSHAANELPKKYNALVDACILSGSNIADRMIPYWDKEDRYFFNPNNKWMKQAMDSVAYKNWQGALSLWNTAYKNTSKNTIKYQAAFNSAIAYEILGDIDAALVKCKEAIDIYNHTTTLSEKSGLYIAYYYQDLTRRKREITQLKNQLGQ